MKKVSNAMRKINMFQAIIIGILLATPVATWAAGMPWEGPICKIATSFSGPVAVAFVVLAVVLCGAMMAFGELNGIFKTLLGVAIGGAMAVGSVQWTTMFAGGTFDCASASIDTVTRVADAANSLAHLALSWV